MKEFLSNWTKSLIHELVSIYSLTQAQILVSRLVVDYYASDLASIPDQVILLEVSFVTFI